MSKFILAVLPVGLTGGTLSYLMAQGLSASLPLVLGTAVVFCYVMFACGSVVLRWLGAGSLSIVAAWPLGVITSGLSLWLLTVALNVTAATAFAVWGLLVLVLDVSLRRKSVAPDTNRKDLFAIAVCCALTAAWCRGTAATPTALAQSGVFHAWIDYFLHGGVIAEFGDPRAIGRGVIWLADVPKFAYHYGSYLLPAAFQVPLGESGLALATSIWLPIGMLSLAAAAYTLGGCLAGSAGGIAALLALFVIPDASNYWLRNGFFSFHWNIVSIPGSTYAIAAGLLSVVLGQRWIQTRSYAALAASAALVAATLLYRVQIFMLLVPSWIVFVAIASPTIRRKWPWFLGGSMLLLALVIPTLQVLSDLVPEAASWAFTEGRALERFLWQVHTKQEPTAYTGLYVKVLESQGDAVAHVFGMALVYPAAIGVFVLLLPAAMLLERGRLQLTGADTFPIAMSILYAVHMALVPTPGHYDATDYAHRPFVLLYAVVAIWTFALAARWLSVRAPIATELGAGVAAIASVLAVYMFAAEFVRPKFDWGKPLASHTVDRDTAAAARFLHDRTRPGELLAVGRLPSRYAHIDQAAELTALTSTPAYLGRTWVHLFMGPVRAEIARTRYNALIAIEQTADLQTALSHLREIGVTWYIAPTNGAPIWDPKHQHARYRHGNLAIYEVPP